MMLNGNLLRQVWMVFCYLWAGAIVVGVILLLRGDDTITPTITDFVVILGVALAPMILPPLLAALYRHLASPAESPEPESGSPDE